MKKLMTLTAIAALTSGAAFAENLNVGGSVASICEVSNINTTVYFANLAKDETQNISFDLQCNDADGATMSLTTAEGHLQNADQEDRGVGYTAELNADAFSFILTAENGVNDQSVEQSQPGSVTLANGGVAGNIELTITENPVFAGTYADTLMLAITAN